MTPAARLASAVEILGIIEVDRKPAADVLKDWGKSHRFAGSGDRAAIAGLVYDTLRRKSSSAYLMDDATPRALALGMLKRERSMDSAAIARLANGMQHALSQLTEQETSRLSSATLDDAPPHILGDYPEWLEPQMQASFGETRAEEGAALASRAPLDLRANALKALRDEAQGDLTDLGAEPTRWSPWGLRINLSPDAKSPGIHAEPAFLKGAIEIQDEGSQLAALFCGARPGMTVLDLCAGAGGKTLALAAMMQNKGRLYATDADKRRLAPIYDRLERAGAKNVEVLTPRRGGDELSAVEGQCDLVVIDAPCSGTGAWRRNPDAKWRMRPGALDQRRKQQAETLDRAVTMLKPGGRIAYITCSVLDEENGAQLRDFRLRHGEFVITPPEEVADALGAAADAFRAAAKLTTEGLLMTPLRTGTDGFFVSILQHEG